MVTSLDHKVHLAIVVNQDTVVSLVTAEQDYQVIVASLVTAVSRVTLALFTLVKHHPQHTALEQCGGMT